MIRLTRPPKPEQLTAELQAELTQEFIESGCSKTVWKKPFITEPLLASTNNKCAFSEVRLNVEGKYMQVEHFWPKSKYPEKVVEWTNLLPILNLCNSHKNDWDTRNKPLVNPMDEDPKTYFYIVSGRVFAIDTSNKKAVNTILRYALNHEQLRTIRFDIENKKKQDLKEYSEHYEENKPHYSRKLLSLMTESGRVSDYSATKSTAILKSPDYSQLRSNLLADGLWTKEHQEAENELLFCALLPPQSA